MFKTRKVDEYGGQTGNEENSEDVTVTEERIMGDDGVERIITKKVTTRKTVQSQQVMQGARVTTTKRMVYTSDGKELPAEFKEHLNLEDKDQAKSIKENNSSSSSEDEEGITSKIKSFLRGGKQKSKDEKKEEHAAIKESGNKDDLPPPLPSSPPPTLPPNKPTSPKPNIATGGKDKVKSNAPKAPSQNETTKEPPTRATDDEKQFNQDCLEWHNYYRNKHSVQPLKLSDKLSKYAKEWAEDIAKRDVMEHRPHNVHGENIFMKWSSDPTFKIAGRDPVENWYHEIKDHVFGAEPTSLKSGHFTQVVWRSCEELGVGKARTKSGKILVVCNYSPAGNIIGEFTANVPTPKF